MPEIDITPSPRILRMLGMIDFKAWQCLFEFIDNSIDSFSREKISNPKITIILPKKDEMEEGLIVKDNGIGMSEKELENCLKAGFSGNDTLDMMGLFGMGSNIAMARLGQVTKIKTSRKDDDHWVEVEIDFFKLEKTNIFKIEPVYIKKTSEEKGQHGTTVTVTKLKEDHFKPLFNKHIIRKKIGKTYGRVLKKYNIELLYDSENCPPFQHCVWDISRSVPHQKHGPIPAVITISETLDTRQYCNSCWVWLSPRDTVCPNCKKSEDVFDRKREVKGWLGIQRYFDTKHFGIDLLRNGRVIEELNKDFFDFDFDDGLTPKMNEYPIDATYAGGRIIGELEIDFVEVSHQKDSFIKSNTDWKDVVKVVRSNSPIQPDIAKKHGLPQNFSPLAKLFSGYRKVQAGTKCLVPANPSGGALIAGGKIEDYVKRFYNNEIDYQKDDKFYELVKAGDSSSTSKPSSTPTSGNLGGGNPFAGNSNTTATPINPMAPVVKDNFVQDLMLSSKYSIPKFKESIKVNVFKNDVDNNSKGFEAELKGIIFNFKYWTRATFFSNNFITPLDCLINELSYQFLHVASSTISKTPLSHIAQEIRDVHFPDSKPSLPRLIAKSNDLEKEIKRHLKANISDIIPLDITKLSNENLDEFKKQLSSYTNSNSKEIDEKIKNGEFIDYVSFEQLIFLITNFPGLLFDNSFFAKTIKNNTIEKADKEQINQLSFILEDISWFIQNHNITPNEFWLGRVKRVLAGMELIDVWRA